MAEVFEGVAQPVATADTRGAWLRGWRLLAIDGFDVDLPDSEANVAEFGYAGSGASRSGGLQGLVAHMERSAEEMEQLRRSPNRGNVDNFPLWKLGGIIVLLGVAIIGAIHCGIFGCSISTRNTYLAALIITALVQIRSAALRSTQNSLPSGSANVTQPEPSARMWSATSLAPSAVSRLLLHPWFRGRAPHPGAAGSSPSCSPMYAGNTAGSVTVEFGG
jgi:hypothetical protein